MTELRAMLDGLSRTKERHLDEAVKACIASAPADHPPFKPVPLTADAVQQYRNATGAGMHEAKQLIRSKLRSYALLDVRLYDTLEDKVTFILDETFGDAA